MNNLYANFKQGCEILIQNRELTLSAASKNALKRNFSIIKLNFKKYEMMFYNKENLELSVNKIVLNSLLGLELETDFYLVNFKGKTVEIKKGSAWKNIAYDFSLKKIKALVCRPIFEQDIYELDMGLEFNFKLTPNFDVDRTKFENLKGAVGIVKFEDGTIDSLFLSKKELEVIRDCSPSYKSDIERGANNSPWNKFPIQMIESKVLRRMVLSEIIPLNKISILKTGLLLSEIEDDKVHELNDDGQIKVVPFEKTQALISKSNNDEVEIEEILLVDEGE